MSRIFLLATMDLDSCQTAEFTYGPAKGSGAGYSNFAEAPGRTTLIYMGRSRANPRHVAQHAMLRAGELSCGSGNVTRPLARQDINNIAGRTRSVLTRNLAPDWT